MRPFVFVRSFPNTALIQEINIYSFTGSGGYNFQARAKKTASNCIHVDFQGALDSGWYFCCGGVPCDLQPK